MVLNGAGLMLHAVWEEIPLHYQGIKIDVFITMPNHIHGIIFLTDVGQNPVGAGPRACPKSILSSNGLRFHYRTWFIGLKL